MSTATPRSEPWPGRRVLYLGSPVSFCEHCGRPIGMYLGRWIHCLGLQPDRLDWVLERRCPVD